MHGLSNQEKREVKALLRPELFRYDIIANLPLELSLQIVNYLEIHVLARSRRVSRRWLELLSSSPKFSYPYLQPFFGARYPCHVGMGRDHFSRMLEELDAYQTGRAFSKRFFGWSIDDFTLSYFDSSLEQFIAYCNGTIAWIDNERGILRALHLDTREPMEYVPTEREKLTHITISKFIVAATTVTGRCYIFELVSGVGHVIRLRSASVSRFVSTGETIAILHKPAQPDFLVYLTTWSLTTRKTRSFSACNNLLAKTAQGYKYSVLVDPTETSFVYFEQFTDGWGKMIFFATRLGLDGKVMSRSSLSVSSADKCKELGDPVPSDNGGTIVVWSDYPCLETTSHRGCRLHQLTYQLQSGTLELQVLPQLAKSPDSFHHGDIFYWKTTIYGLWQDSREIPGDIFVADSDQGVCRDAEMWTLSMTDREAEIARVMRRKHRIVGDDRFILLIHPAGFIAWCFDKTVTMAAESTLYREGRAKEMERRLEDKESLSGKVFSCPECYCDSLITCPPPSDVAFE